MASTDNQKLYKVLVIGDLNTKKTSIIKRYVHQYYSPHYRATIGVDFALKVLNWDANTTVRLQLWDIAGQERFGKMTRIYYKEAVGAVIVFDITRLSTFEAVQMWKADLDNTVQLPNGKPIPTVLLAHDGDHELSTIANEGFLGNTSQLDDYCREKGFLAWFETSAKRNIGINEAFHCLVAKILENDGAIKQAGPIDSKMSLSNISFDRQLHEETSKLKSCHSEKDDLQRQHREMKEQVTQLQEEKDLIEQKSSTLTAELSQRIAQLESEIAVLKSEKQSLQEQLTKCQEENRQFLTAQQESVAFGIEPWKVAHDKVELGSLIGGGGWGAVNEGKLKVAVKQFYPNILSKPNLARLQREMRILALIRHPNLLQFIAAAFDKGGNHRKNPPYIITELLDTSLRAAYEEKQLENKHKLSVFQDTARALDYLHRRCEPIIHRDVSSANVLLKRQPNGSWVAKVSDLGSANLAHEAYTLNEGSVVYCAPEAFTDKSKTRSDDTLTTKIDVYSFGIMLCEVVTAQFPSEDEFPLMLKSARRLWPKIHPLIESCVEKDPVSRPSMADVLTTLQSIPPRRLINF